MQEQFLLFFQNYQYPAFLLNLVGEIINFNPATTIYFSEFTLENPGNSLDLGLRNFFASISQALLFKKNLSIHKSFLGYNSLLKFSLINDGSESLILLLIEPEISLSKKTAVDQENVDELIQSLIHELKAPLVTIFGFSLALQEDYSYLLDKQGVSFLESVNRSAKNLDDKLMALAELTEVSKKAIYKEVIDFKEILQNAYGMLKSMIEKRNTIITTTSDLPNLNCNPDLMVKVVVNLISNAIKFTPQECQPIIKVACEKQTKNYQFCITDQGIGIDTKFQKKIFEPFYRVKELQRVSGVGLGLALVKRIIQAHNGKLRVKSISGEGSSFYFTIPI
ncbi:MAG: HAMP domain-containing histidine kinase [Acidobacteria bacterium]|nr:HAMP domain-containing histidine kinase [Acidobacteriota bacterium]